MNDKATNKYAEKAMNTRQTEMSEPLTAAEYHYAPITGSLVCMKDGEMEKVEGWTRRHALMEQFLKLRASNEIILLRTESYGHMLFHGHRGRVDIYGSPNDQADRS